jgi:hypothetical protein
LLCVVAVSQAPFAQQPDEGTTQQSGRGKPSAPEPDCDHASTIESLSASMRR